MLLKKGAQVGLPDVEGKTPLHWAASCGGVMAKNRLSEATKCVEALLGNAQNVINWQDYEGRIALHLGKETAVSKFRVLHFTNPRDEASLVHPTT